MRSIERFAADQFDDGDVEDYPDAIGEVDETSTKYGIDVNDARDGVLLYRVGSDQEADLIVTEREWLLADRHRPHRQLLTNVVSPDEAMAIIGLYLRWHQRAVIIGGASTRWHPTSMRRSAAYIAMPAFERWNQAGRVWYDTTNDLTLEDLNRTLLTHMSRAFQFRDSTFALSTTMVDHEPEDMLCELDSLLFPSSGRLTSPPASPTSCSDSTEGAGPDGRTPSTESGSPAWNRSPKTCSTTRNPGAK